MKESYTTRKICRGLGISERELIHWAEKGLVKPLVGADGYASRRQYSRENVFEIAIINSLWGKVSNSTIKRAISWLSLWDFDPRVLGYLVIVGEEVKSIGLGAIEGRPGISEKHDRLRADSYKAFIEALKNSELIIILNVKKIFDEVLNLLA